MRLAPLRQYILIVEEGFFWTGKNNTGSNTSERRGGEEN